MSVSELVAAAALRKEGGALRVQLVSSQNYYLKSKEEVRRDMRGIASGHLQGQRYEKKSQLGEIPLLSPELTFLLPGNAMLVSQESGKESRDCW